MQSQGHGPGQWKVEHEPSVPWQPEGPPARQGSAHQTKMDTIHPRVTPGHSSEKQYLENSQYVAGKRVHNSMESSFRPCNTVPEGLFCKVEG